MLALGVKVRFLFIVFMALNDFLGYHQGSLIVSLASKSILPRNINSGLANAQVQALARGLLMALGYAKAH